MQPEGLHKTQEVCRRHGHARNTHGISAQTDTGLCPAGSRASRQEGPTMSHARVATPGSGIRIKHHILTQPASHASYHAMDCPGMLRAEDPGMLEQANAAQEACGSLGPRRTLKHPEADQGRALIPRRSSNTRQGAQALPSAQRRTSTAREQQVQGRPVTGRPRKDRYERRRGSAD